MSELTTLTLDKLEPDPENLRREMDDASLKELALSIASQGLLEPLVVRRNGSDVHKIVAGNRRHAAIKMLVDRGKVPADYPISVIIRDDLTDEQVTMAMLVENLQRVDLNPVEEALGYLRLTGFGMTQKAIATSIGRPQKHVASRLRLAGLPDAALDGVRAGKVTLQHADILADLIDLAGPDALTEEALSSEWKAEQAYHSAVKESATAAIRAKVPEGIDMPDLGYEEKSRLTRVGEAITLEDPTADFEIPDGTEIIDLAHMHSGSVRVTFYRPMTEKEAAKANPRTSASAKEKRKAELAKAREERKVFLEWAGAVCARPKVGDLNAFLPDLVKALILTEEAKEIAAVLGIEPLVTEHSTYDGKTRKQRDFTLPVKGYFEESDANARRVIAAFLVTNWRTRAEAVDRFDGPGKQAKAKAKAKAKGRGR